MKEIKVKNLDKVGICCNPRMKTEIKNKNLRDHSRSRKLGDSKELAKILRSRN